MRAALVAAIVGVLVALSAHVLGTMLLVFGILLVLVGIVLTLTAIGAVLGLPLIFLGVVVGVFGAVSAHGIVAALVLGSLAGLSVYLQMGKRKARAFP
jgi:hypothetical protein